MWGCWSLGIVGIYLPKINTFIARVLHLTTIDHLCDENTRLECEVNSAFVSFKVILHRNNLFSLFTKVDKSVPESVLYKDP